MNKNIENLELQEIAEIPVTEDRKQLYAISVDSNGEAKAYPLENIPTKDEVDDKLKNKADDKEFKKTQQDLKTTQTSISEKATIASVTRLEEISATKVELNEVKSIATNAQAGMTPMGRATSEADLNTKPKRNNDSYFRLDTLDGNNNPYIWRYDAALEKWINTFQITYVNDAATHDDLKKKPNGIFTSDAHKILNNFSAIKDMWFADGSTIPTQPIYLWYVQQQPAVNRRTIYITMDDGTGQSIVGGESGILAAFVGVHNEGIFSNVETLETIEIPNGTHIGLKLKMIVDWSKVSNSSEGTSRHARLDVNAIQASTIAHAKAERPNGVVKTIFPFFTKESDIYSIKDIGIYGIKMFGTPSSTIETIGLGHVGMKLDENKEPTIYLYMMRNKSIANADIIGIFRQKVSDITAGVKRVVLEQANNSGVFFVAYVDLMSIAQLPLLTTTSLVLDKEYLSVPNEFKTLNQEWEEKGLIKYGQEIEDCNLLGLINVRLLSDSKNYLQSGNPVYLWAYGNAKGVDGLFDTYVYFTKEKYISNQSVIAYTSVRTTNQKDITERFIVNEQNESGVSFEVTIDWGILKDKKIDNGIKLQINPNMPLAAVKKDEVYINFEVDKNLPIIPNKIYLRSDKSIPLYKNSLFTDLKNLEKVDVGIIANGRVYPIHEPTHLGGVDGLQISGKAKLFLSRTSDYSKLYYKDIDILLKDVSTLAGKRIKVLPLGDSITEGLEYKNTPITMLAERLKAIGVTLDYTGTLARNLKDKQGQNVKINYEGRGGWRYRTFVGRESKVSNFDVVIPSPTKSEWMVGVDGENMNAIKFNHAFLYPATAQDLANYPTHCFHFVVGGAGYNKSYAEDKTLGTYHIFDPTRYFSERNIEIPDIVTIALGTNEWYLGNFQLKDILADAKFMFQAFRRASPTMKIVVIPANAINMRLQEKYWEKQASVLTSAIMKICEELNDPKLYVCPIYAHSSRWLAFDNTIDAPIDISEYNSMKSVTINSDVHSIYVEDESNVEYGDSYANTVINLID